MEALLITFAVFLVAAFGMAIGWIVKGKALSGSCGGAGPDGESIADCLCELINKPVCGSRRAELGLPPLEPGEEHSSAGV